MCARGRLPISGKNKKTKIRKKKRNFQFFEIFVIFSMFGFLGFFCFFVFFCFLGFGGFGGASFDPILIFWLQKEEEVKEEETRWAFYMPVAGKGGGEACK